MKFIEGEYYKTREGKKALLLSAVNPFGDLGRPMCGYIQGRDGAVAWTKSGSAYGDHGPAHSCDLVAEWNDVSSSEITEEQIKRLYNLLCDWADGLNSAGPSSPPDFSLPCYQDGFAEVVAEWAKEVACT